MEKEKYEVVIIGAGPAGLASAEVLAEHGKRVLVLEKNKEVGKKICGGGLSRKFLKLGYPLKKLNGKIFNSVKYHFGSKERTIKEDFPFIAITEREELGEYMKDKAEKRGAKVRVNCQVTKISEKFVIASDKKIYFDYLIGADGSNSLVRRFLKIPSKKFLFSLGYSVPRRYENLEIFFDAEIFKDGYGAIFPHKEYTQFGITVDSKFYTMKEAKKILDKWLSRMRFDIGGGKFMAGIINYDYRGFEFENKFLVGDAGGFASGLNGEGIFQAVISGKEVARKIIDKNYKCPGISHILNLKFIHEKFFKKILKSSNNFLLNWGGGNL